jgi:enterochelin esterase-like enzyme
MNTVGEDPAAAQAAATNDADSEVLWEECHEDVTMPPGGDAKRMLVKTGMISAAGMPLPDYLTRRGRDLRIDMLRGFFVVAMIIDHVRGQSPLYLLTGGNRFYTSAAEGFILTSGLVAGLVYRRLIERDELSAALQKIMVRAVSLYLLTVGLTLLFLPVSEILYLPWAQGVDLSNPLKVVVSILTLHRTYYLVDVMLLYTVLFIVTPLAFILLSRGHAWPVLGVSLGLWALFQVFPDYASLPWPIAGNYLFDFSAWQLLFFGGLVLGYRQDRIPALGCRETRIALVLSSIGMVILVAAFFMIEQPITVGAAHVVVTAPVGLDVRTWLQDYVFSKVDLRPGRIVASAITFTFLFLLATHFWNTARRLLAWLLLPLGQHALYAYTAHILIAAGIAVLLKPLNLPAPGPQWLNALIQIASVLLVWLLVRVQFLAPQPKTMRLWYAMPAALAMIAFVVMYRNPMPTLAAAASGAVAQAGTADVRAPTRFGTPIAKGAIPAAPQVMPTPTPLPQSVTGANVWQSSTADATTRLSRYTPGLQGTLVERQFYSSELDRDMPYNIYLPPDYDRAGRRYPVLFMLHGGGAHRDEWLAYGLVDAADREFRTGSLQPMIIVMPQGDTGYWTDNANDGPRWGQYVWRDLVRHIDNTYRTLRSPLSRAIGGLSMGGWGALNNAFLHPNVFGVVGAHSPSLRPDDGSLPIMGTGAEFAARDPVSLAATAQGIENLQIWIDAGQDDPWLDQDTMIHDALTARSIQFTYGVLPGGHDYTYWMAHVLDYLRFYGNALAQH